MCNIKNLKFRSAPVINSMLYYKLSCKNSLFVCLLPNCHCFHLMVVISNGLLCVLEDIIAQAITPGHSPFQNIHPKQLYPKVFVDLIGKSFNYKSLHKKNPVSLLVFDRIFLQQPKKLFITWFIN